jgi:hypothetical protein
MNARLVAVLKAFWHNPGASIPKVMASWGGAKSVYRFFSNRWNSDLTREEKVSMKWINSYRKTCEIQAISGNLWEIMAAKFRKSPIIPHPPWDRR